VIGRGRNLSEAREEMVFAVKSARPVRLDQYLREALAWRSRTRIQQLIRAGRVSVNGRPAKPAASVRSGDRVAVRVSLGTGVPADYGERELDVLYEDPWLLVLNKPPGMLVHPVGRHVYDTLMNYLHYRYREAMESGKNAHIHLCHRIDRDTSGALVVAKDRYVHAVVQKEFQSRRVSKSYLTLARGRIPAGLERIDRPLREGRSLAAAIEGPEVKPSLTRIEVLERFAAGGEEYTWLAASPVTGRTNQIRIHLASIGHPLPGDRRFGGGPPPEGFPQRFILHARRIRFHHPRLKSDIEIEAPLPADVEALLERLRGGENPS
jgi:23S rRNA pseudouridine1911/1915/1917 synthase